MNAQGLAKTSHCSCVTRGRRQLGRPAAQRDRIGICTRRLPPRPSTPRSVGVATVNHAQRMYESSTEEGSTANCTHQISFYDAKGRHGEKRIRKFRRRLASDARMVRRTHARDRMPQHGRITAHWNLDSRLQEGQGARDLRQKDAHVQPIPAGKQVKSADWHWGT